MHEKIRTAKKEIDHQMKKLVKEDVKRDKACEKAVEKKKK